MNNNEKTISFSINKYGWILLFQRLGSKVIMRAVSIKKPKRIKDESDHRMDEVVAEGGVKVRSKLYDISRF